ncbi:MAG: LamG domain-containing protein [Phycisphaerales bacterium]|nr:LamG domain-containing protein [Phycisphaerales bacterium]
MSTDFVRFHRPSRMRSRRRGVALLLVLVAAVIAFTISSALLTSQATTITIAQNAADRAQARYVAESGLRLAAAYVQSSASWRTDQSAGTWISNEAYGPGSFTVAGYDGADANGDGVITQPGEGDGNLSDDDGDTLTLEVTGKVNGATYVARAVVTPGSSAAPTPKYYWKLDETTGTTAADSVGDRDGSLVNFTYSDSKWITAQVDGGLHFDGYNDYVDIGSGCMATTAWTVAMWLRPIGPSDYQRLFLQGSSACGSRQIMVIWHNGHLEVRTTTSGAAGDPQAASASISTGSWTHFAWVYDGSSHALYVNGALSSGSVTGNNVGVDGSNYLGRRSSGNYWDGDLDDVQFFDRALSSEEVNAVINGSGGTTTEITPLAHWPMDDGGGGTADDASGNGYDATLINMSTYSDWVSGQYGGALEFDGYNDYLAIGSFPNLTGSFTITAWIRPDRTTGDQRIFCDDANNNSGFSVSLGDGGAGRLRLFSRAINPVIVDGSAAISSGSWQFVAAVHDLDAKKRRLYVGSSELGGDSSAYSGTWGTDTGVATIGGEADGTSEGSSTYRFDGRIDDVRVYSQALTAEQLAEVAAGNNPTTTSGATEFAIRWVK